MPSLRLRRARPAGWFTAARMGALLFVAGCWPDAAADTVHVADANLPRPALESQPADDISLVMDFDARADTLWLLEAGTDLIRYELQSGVWRRVARLTREGDGPGELRRAWGVALTPAGLAAIDGVRAHFFAPDGEYVKSTPLGLPCMMTKPGLAWSGNGVFLHGSCRRAGLRADTMKAILAWSTDTLSWQVVAEGVDYVTDGSRGSPFGPARGFTAGIEHHLFGTAADDCLLRILPDGAPGESICGIASQTYRSPPPPDVAARMGRGPVRGVNVAWPDPLPAYMERLVTPVGDFVLRPFSVDSVLLQRAGGDYEDVAVLPFNTLVGCKAAGCLWVEEAETTRILLLRPAHVAELMTGAEHDE